MCGAICFGIFIAYIISCVVEMMFEKKKKEKKKKEKIIDEAHRRGFSKGQRVMLISSGTFYFVTIKDFFVDKRGNIVVTTEETEGYVELSKCYAKVHIDNMFAGDKVAYPRSDW